MPGFGWEVALWMSDGRRIALTTPPGSSYKDAVALRTREMAHGNVEKAWISHKTGA